MSGPKIVRVVTREEHLEQCRSALRRLDRMIELWRAEIRRDAVSDEKDLEAMLARKDSIEKLIDSDSFALLQRRADSLTDFLQSDLEARRKKAMERRVRLKVQRRQMGENARLLLKMAATGRGSLSDGVRMRLISISEGTFSADDENILLHAVKQISEPDDSAALSSSQRQLQQALIEDPAALPHGSSAFRYRDPQLQRIDCFLADMELQGGAEESAGFSARLHEIERLDDEKRRHLLLDSLLLELGDTSRTLAERARLKQALSLLQAEHSPVITEDEQLRREFGAIDTLHDIESLKRIHERCSLRIREIALARAAEQRRGRVLEGLARLGYEVHEGMETAWASEGSLVLKKAAMPRYGVELGGNGTAGRVQMRAVAFGESRDRQQDLDAELIWCDEFKRLKTLLAEKGGTLQVEQAVAAGRTPLKVVADEKALSRQIPDEKQRHK